MLGAPLTGVAALGVGLVWPAGADALSRAHPALAAAWMRLAGVGWVAAAFALCAISGGIASVALAVFLVGPAQALARGDRRLASELAGFAGLAAGGLGLLQLIVGLPGESGWVAPLSILPGLAALVWAGACLFAASAGRVALPASPNGAAIQARATGASPQGRVPTEALPALPATAPAALVYLDRDERVQRVSGNPRLIPPLAVGDRLDAAFAQADGSDGLAEGPRGGTVFRLRRPRPGGSLWLIVEADGLKETLAAVEQAAQRTRDEAVRARTAFFAGLGHDLKTPLNAILGFSEMMQAELRGPLPEAYRDYAGLIQESGQDLMLLVEDLLDLARSESAEHRLDLEPVDLAASGESVLRQLAAQAERAGVSLTLSAPPGETWAHADARAVRQIWQNLVSNAIKYSEPGGTVTLGVGREGDRVALWVADRGAGMSRADLDRIAAPFAQGENARGRTGTGLGLAVVKRFADLQGGTVRIDTAPGQGTRVDVRLPPAAPGDLAPLEDAAQ